MDGIDDFPFTAFPFTQDKIEIDGLTLTPKLVNLNQSEGYVIPIDGIDVLPAP